MDGNVFKLRTKTCDIIHTLKSKIQSISGFSPGKQRLVFDGKHLTDTRFVGDYNIQTNSMILLFPRQKNIFVIVRALTGQKMAFEMQPRDTVADMKALVMRKMFRPIHSFSLMLENHGELVDEHCLHAVGIGNKSTVYLVFRTFSGYGERTGHLLNKKPLLTITYLKNIPWT